MTEENGTERPLTVEGAVSGRGQTRRFYCTSKKASEEYLYILTGWYFQ